MAVDLFAILVITSEYERVLVKLISRLLQVVIEMVTLLKRGRNDVIDYV